MQILEKDSPGTRSVLGMGRHLEKRLQDRCIATKSGWGLDLNPENKHLISFLHFFNFGQSERQCLFFSSRSPAPPPPVRCQRIFLIFQNITLFHKCLGQSSPVATDWVFLPVTGLISHRATERKTGRRRKQRNKYLLH